MWKPFSEEDQKTIWDIRWRWFSGIEVLIENPGAIGADTAIVIAIASVNLRTYFGTPTVIDLAG